MEYEGNSHEYVVFKWDRHNDKHLNVVWLLEKHTPYALMPFSHSQYFADTSYH